jgi:putative protein-disulfide isomerase
VTGDILAILYYIHDPMCSWCWGYRPTWSKLKASLPPGIEVVNLLGGLAPDNEQPMPAELQQTIQGHWRKIHALLGTEFNFDFWTQCRPRRDTYKASRAVVVAAESGLEEEMIHAIQQAYYLRAMNPSEPETLVQLAGVLGMNTDTFRSALVSEQTDQEFRRQVGLARRLGVRSFPSLVLKIQDRINRVSLDYKDHRVSLQDIRYLVTSDRQIC